MTRLTFSAGNHSYYLADPDSGRKARITSVTALLGQLDKPALKRWAANTAADYAIDHWDGLAAMNLSARRAAIAGSPWQERDTKAARGTAVHAMAERLIAGEPVEVPGDLAGHVEGLARWIERSGFRARLTEAMVWSDEDPDLGLCAYAGTFDTLGEHPAHGLALIDWKTSNGVYSEHGVQVAGYAAAEHIVIDGEDQPLPPIAALGVAHIRTDGTSLHWLTPDERRIAAQRFELLRLLKNVPEPTLTMEAVPA